MTEPPTTPPRHPAPPSSVPSTTEARLLDEFTGTGLDWRSTIAVPALAIVSALIVGAVVIALGDLDTLRLWTTDPGRAVGDTLSNVGSGYKALFLGAVGGIGPISETLTRAAPLILAGLALAVGFQAGLFNIGAQGQMIFGGMFAVTVGFSFNLPAFIHIPLCIVAGIIGGAIWGAIPGWLRAKSGAHEVITTIMLNFIALRLLDYALTRDFFQVPGRNDPVSKSVESTALYPKLFAWLDPRHRVHMGIIVALLVALLVYWLLFRSTIGFQFRAVGANPDGARYAGMSVVWLTVAVMAVSGGLAGLAGADLVLGPLGRATPGFAGNVGFDAIAIALVGRSHPFGVVAAGLLFGGLAAGGQAMQASTAIGIDVVSVIQALIIVFIAAPALIRAIYRVRADTESTQVTQGWAT